MHYLIRNCAAIASHPDCHDLRIRANRIAEIGNQLELLDAEVIDGSQCVLYPGLVNSHHHLAQSLFKAVPAGLNQHLGEWLGSVPYQYWPHMTPNDMYLAATLGLYELMRSGTTICADHHYLYHIAATPEMEDAVWQAADDLGIRLVLCRGGATNTGTHQGLAKAGIKPENLEQMLTGLQASLDQYHQPQADAMRRLVVAPTSLVHTSPPDDLRQLAGFARANGLRMHSHLLEVGFDEQQSQRKYGMSAVNYAESVNWLGEDVWFAHLVQANEADIQTLAASRTGIGHCPTSNGRLGSGIAKVLAMHKAGMQISLGVDGAASSENGSMLQEANLSWLLQRAANASVEPDLAQVLSWASADGAKLLGFEDSGEIAVGKLADLCLFDISAARYQGMMSAEWAPLLGGEPVSLKAGFINGKLRVENGAVAGLDVEKLAADLAQAREGLIRRALG
ncbi:amidohydrolase family protein [Oceanobacter mangrovi]|uniref:amidohydrolase family protein n=1 Tax=Oceanobacter mangrovi TaxID=2862510 RepID=UPI001C8D6123|nr:amidohydrolase family protein [Oceanobacter mangrovi]